MPAQRPPVLCGILCAALLIVTLAWGHQPPVRAAEPAIVYASGGSLVSGTPGPAAVLPVQAANVQSLGAATVLVGYDPASLKAIACQRNTLFDVGLCNTTYDRNADGTPDAVLFNVVSLLGVSAPGPVVLTNITWQSVTAVSEATITALSVQVQTFADTEGKPLSHSGQNGKITLLPVPPTPTATATPAPTPTRTVTPTLATKKIYLPLLLRTFTAASTPTATPTAQSPIETPSQTPTPTATPDPSQPPVFTCSDWCTPGGTPGWRRQTITSSRPVVDWRAYVNFTLHQDLTSETALMTIAEAPENASVRIEALFNGDWLLACKSVVLCGH